VTDVPLADAIEALRQQLTAAMLAGEKSPLRFTVEELTLELEVAVSYGGGGHAGIKFWLVDFGGKGEHSNAATHRIAMKLKPMDEHQQHINLGDTSALKPG